MNKTKGPKNIHVVMGVAIYDPHDPKTRELGPLLASMPERLWTWASFQVKRSLPEFFEDPDSNGRRRRGPVRERRPPGKNGGLDPGDYPLWIRVRRFVVPDVHPDVSFAKALVPAEGPPPGHFYFFTFCGYLVA